MITGRLTQAQYDASIKISHQLDGVAIGCAHDGNEDLAELARFAVIYIDALRKEIDYYRNEDKSVQFDDDVLDAYNDLKRTLELEIARDGNRVGELTDLIERYEQALMHCINRLNVEEAKKFIDLCIKHLSDIHDCNFEWWPLS